MTLGATSGIRLVALRGLSVGRTGTAGEVGVGTVAAAGRPEETVIGAVVAGVGPPSTGTRCEGGFCGKRGVVFALAGAPVSGGAIGGGGVGAEGGGGMFAGALEIDGIGLVTAVDQAGGTLVAGAGVNCPVVCIGNVLAAETLGLG